MGMIGMAIICIAFTKKKNRKRKPLFRLETDF